MSDESTVITAAVASILDAWVDTTGGDPETTEDIADAIVRTVQSLTITPDLPECVHDDKVLANIMRRTNLAAWQVAAERLGGGYTSPAGPCLTFKAE